MGFRLLEIRALLRRMVMIAVALSLALPLLDAFGGGSRAFASGVLNDRNYAGQYTAYNNPGGSYYGWRGVRGHIFIKNYPVLADWDTQQFSAYLSASSSTPKKWVQVGYGTQPGQPFLWRYYEVSYAEGSFMQLFSTYPAFTPPGGGDELFEIKSRDGAYGEDYFHHFGYLWQARCYDAGSLHAFAMDDPNGRSAAMAEIKNGSSYNEFADTYFGTNKVGWNGNAYALVLRNGAGTWESWDEDLTAYETMPDTGFDPPYHYSPGIHWKYFGAWNQ